MGECVVCDGSGVLDRDDPEGHCPACDNYPCARCGGTGQVDTGCADPSPDCCGYCPSVIELCPACSTTPLSFSAHNNQPEGEDDLDIAIAEHLPATAGVFAMNRTYHQPACSCGWYEEGRCYTTMKEAMSVARRHAADNAHTARLSTD